MLTKRNFIRTVTDIKPEWFFDIAPDYFNPQNIKHIETKKELEKIERELVMQKLKSKQ